MRAARGDGARAGLPVDHEHASRTAPSAGSGSGAGAKSISGLERGHAAHSRASARGVQPASRVRLRGARDDDAPDRQPRLEHVQPLPAAGASSRAASRSSCATTRRDWAALRAERFARCVISAGPGPARPPARLRPLARARSTQAELPVLGVCLGHQGLALAPRRRGRPRARADARTPQRASTTTGSELFDGIPQGFLAVRYHSLAVREPLPRGARGDRPHRVGHRDGAAPPRSGRTGASSSTRSRSRPNTASGCSRNFIAGDERDGAPARAPAAGRARAAAARRRAGARDAAVGSSSSSATVSRPVDAETAFVGLFGGAPNAFWLDSSRGDGGGALLLHGRGRRPAVARWSATTSPRTS